MRSFRWLVNSYIVLCICTHGNELRTYQIIWWFSKEKVYIMNVFLLFTSNIIASICFSCLSAVQLFQSNKKKSLLFQIFQCSFCLLIIAIFHYHERMWKFSERHFNNSNVNETLLKALSRIMQLLYRLSLVKDGFGSLRPIVLFPHRCREVMPTVNDSMYIVKWNGI